MSAEFLQLLFAGAKAGLTYAWTTLGFFHHLQREQQHHFPTLALRIANA